ncbi:hypothetical protein Bhyg_02476 [Pseudolycoriella hygida]|uniref:Uncharacterized protein n=1 Tax=Pseudolycoriella hygida TaxID=35572 RepID=A0A9Q0NDA5_9DIPT|nr:hypothetical protein Bhyg_02476 [Pseudolycoriella hygida]
MIPCDNNYETILHGHRLNYESCFYKYEESKCDKPLLAHDVFTRWINATANLANLTENEIRLAAYTGYSLMYRASAENDGPTVVQ